MLVALERAQDLGPEATDVVVDIEEPEGAVLIDVYDRLLVVEMAVEFDTDDTKVKDLVDEGVFVPTLVTALEGVLVVFDQDTVVDTEVAAIVDDITILVVAVGFPYLQ